MHTKRAVIAAGVLVVAILSLFAVACGDDDDASVDGPGAPVVERAWARTSPAMADAAAVYLQITSPGGDRLVGAAVDASVAGVTELHETVAADGHGADGASMDDGAMDGHSADEGHAGEMMTMRELEDGLALPAGEQVTLEPGGYHIMLLDLASPLAAGQTFELTLQLERAGSVVVEVEVRDQAP